MLKCNHNYRYCPNCGAKLCLGECQSWTEGKHFLDWNDFTLDSKFELCQFCKIKIKEFLNK